MYIIQLYFGHQIIFEMADQENKRILCVGVICLDIISVCDKYPDEDTEQRLTSDMAGHENKRILCVGMICLDIISVCDKYPEEDTDQRSLDYFWRRGGNASNSSTVLSLLGANIEVLGTMVKDQKAELEFFQTDFKTFGIKCENCPLYGEPYRCPTAVIIISKETGSRTILAALKSDIQQNFSGSNRLGTMKICSSQSHHKEVSFEDFSKVDLNNYKWIHFEGRRNGEEIGRMMDKVIAHNDKKKKSEAITISLELEKRNRPQLVPLVQKADHVFMSKDVAREKGYNTKESAVSGCIGTCKEGATIVCAWGEDGAAALTQGSSVVTSKAFSPDSLVDTIGAGDTFNAASILALSEGKTIHEAITFGCKVAGAKCGAMGFQHLKGMQKLL